MGEVMDHARRLQAAGLSHRGLCALLVIAEGCRAETRRGRIPRDRVADVLDSSERTATRALGEVVTAQLATVVERGKRLPDVYDPATGTSHPRGIATLYELAPLGEPRDTWVSPDPPQSGDTQVSPDPAEPRDTQVSSDRLEPQDTQVSPGSGNQETNPAEPGDKSSTTGRRLGVTHPVVSPVVSPGGSRTPVREAPPPASQPLGPEPPRRCAEHRDQEQVPACGRCKDARLNWERWRSDADRWEQERAERAALPPPCGQCDARADDAPAARLVWRQDGQSEPCPRCHPKAIALC